MPLRSEPPDIAERIARCPIHQAINVDRFMDAAKMPEKFRPAFRELVLLSGEITGTSYEDDLLFAKGAKEIMKRNKINPRVERLLSQCYVGLRAKLIGFQ